MSDQPTHPVLVGYDGSASARLAAHWAAREAVSAGRPLRLAYTFRWPLPELTPLDLPGGAVDAGQVRMAAAELVNLEVDRLREMLPNLDVRAEILTGGTVELLAQLATQAALLVLGSAGQSGVSRVLLGSSAAELARQVTAPVIVVRDTPSPPAPEAEPAEHVVVGVDGSAPSARAIEFGFDYAARHHHRLVAVHAWSDLPLDALETWSLQVIDPHQAQQRAEARLTRQLAAALVRHPQVPVRHVVCLDRPAQALLDQAAGSALVVVGRHGRAHRPESPLGSVSHAVLHYAKSAVAVVGAG
jgi:nucleotide-binding universal stress UspA family protein